MTVTYSRNVALSQKSFSVFLKLLFRWRGSVYKLVWRDLVVFTLVYAALSLVYNFALQDGGKRLFANVVTGVRENGRIEVSSLIFVLGFYTSHVMQQRHAFYSVIPCTDAFAMAVSAALRGRDSHVLRLRQTLVRYANLACTLTLTNICLPLKKRMPTAKHFIETGFMTEQESEIIQNLDPKAKGFGRTYWVPLVWATNVITRSETYVGDREKTTEISGLNTSRMLDELHKLSRSCNQLMSHDQEIIPLVYTQMVTLAVYLYALGAVIAGQFLDGDHTTEGLNYNYYVPAALLLQIGFYCGWLRVAETLINPLGEDDNDFDINPIINRNITVSRQIIGKHGMCPEQFAEDEVDYFTNKWPRNELPYTVASKTFDKEPYRGSFAEYEVRSEKQKFVVSFEPDQVDIEMMTLQEPEDDQVSRKGVLPSVLRRRKSRKTTRHLRPRMKTVSIEELEQQRKRQTKVERQTEKC